MRLSEFDYVLPPELVAQYPLPERDASRHGFRELRRWLRPGDLLVLNEAKVIPARLVGRRRGGGQAEVLLLEEQSPERWWALVKPGRRLPVGEHLTFPERVDAHVVGRGDGGRRLLAFGGSVDVRAFLLRAGFMPLPPYVRRRSGVHRREDAVDRERYQTVYASEAGAIAAPTAGLHFTRALLQGLERDGVEMAYLTLHVSVGTFAPVTADRVLDHRMAPERYHIPERTAAAIKRAKAERRRVVAVGTTATRALEDAASRGGTVRAGAGTAALFIVPGHMFRVVDGLLTNFHLPGSTLLMLVSAFASRELVLQAYAEAIRERYRFYSYGDAMLIL
jgi:S-adenosylmethionine:tRNA ribosyltransferase-isomerase